MQLLYFVYRAGKDTQPTSKPPAYKSLRLAVPVDVVRHLFAESSAVVPWQKLDGLFSLSSVVSYSQIPNLAPLSGTDFAVL